MRIFACFGGCSPLTKNQTDINLRGHNLITLQQCEEVYRSSKTLIKLNVESNRLRCLPQKFWKTKFPKLEVLILCDNDINVIANDIKMMENLRELDVSRNDIESLPNDLGQCKKLEKLNLGANPLSLIPDEFCQLQNLKILSCNGVSLMDLPFQMGNMRSLEVLECRENLIRSIPESIVKISTLKQLDLGENEVEDLPDEIGKLKSLQELWLDKNELTTLPESLGQLASLICLDLQTNAIESLPRDLSGLHSLADLTVSDNKLTSIPTSIGMLTKLSILKIDSNNIDFLPDQIGQCAELTELILTNNKLTQLPREISKLKKLNHLNADSNLLTSVPPELGDLPELSLLSLRENKLTEIPKEIGKLSRLTVMDLASNQLHHLPVTLKNLTLRALWLAENQSQSLIQMQEQRDDETGEDILTCFLLPQMSNQDGRSWRGEAVGGSMGFNGQGGLERSGHTGRTYEDLRMGLEDDEEFGLDEGPPPNFRERTVFIQIPAEHQDRHNNSGENGIVREEISSQEKQGYFDDKRPKQLTPHPQLRKDLQKKANQALHNINQKHESPAPKSERPQNRTPSPMNGAEPYTTQEETYSPQDYTSQKSDGYSPYVPTSTQQSSGSPTPKKQAAPVLPVSMEAQNWRRRGLINNDFNDRQDQMCVNVDATPLPGSHATTKAYSLGLSIAGGKNSPAFIDDDPAIYISKVMEGGACHRAGLKGHDKIIAVNGQSLVGATHEDAVTLLRSASQSNPSCIKFVILRTRQVAEYNIKLTPEATEILPISVAVDKDVNLLTITSINNPGNVDLAQAVRAGDNLLRVNGVDVAECADQTWFPKAEVFEDLSINEFPWLNLLVFRPLIAKEELLTTSESNVPDHTLKMFQLVQKQLYQKHTQRPRANASPHQYSSQPEPPTYEHATQKQQHYQQSQYQRMDNNSDSTYEPPNPQQRLANSEDQLQPNGQYAAYPQTRDSTNNLIANTTTTTISSNNTQTRLNSNNSSPHRGMTVPSTIAPIALTSSTTSPPLTSGFSSAMETPVESNTPHLPANVAQRLNGSLQPKPQESYNPYQRLRESPEVKAVDPVKIVTQPVAELALHTSATHEVETAEVASPERLTFKDRMALFSDSSSRLNSSSNLKTSSSNLRDVKREKVSLLSRQDLQRMEDSQSSTSLQQVLPASHQTTPKQQHVKFSKQQTHEAHSKSTTATEVHRVANGTTPMSPDSTTDADQVYSALQNFSIPYQRLGDAPDAASALQQNQKQPPAASAGPSARPTATTTAHYQLNQGRSPVKHAHQPSDVDTSSVFSFANSMDRIEELDQIYRVASGDNAGLENMSSQSRREFDQIRRIKERQQRMRELDSDAFTAEQLINAGKS